MAEKIVVMNHITGRVDVFVAFMEDNEEPEDYLKTLGYDTNIVDWIYPAAVHDDRRKETLEEEVQRLNQQLVRISKEYDDLIASKDMAIQDACTLLFEHREEACVRDFLIDNMNARDYIQLVLGNSDIDEDDKEFIMGMI